MCQLYRPRLPTGCAEDDVEEVREKERANFCDYFTPSAEAYSPVEVGAQSEARMQLDALFGDDATGAKSDGTTSSPEDDARRRAEKLFKG